MRVFFFSRRTIPEEQSLIKFSQSICRSLPLLRGKGEVCVVFVSDPQITKMNRQFLKKSRPTDVIAFRYPKSSFPFGDIYISLDTANRQAKSGGHDFKQELALLILHGLLHLIGYEDQTISKQRKMFSKQRALFREIAPALAPPDFR